MMVTLAFFSSGSGTVAGAVAGGRPNRDSSSNCCLPGAFAMSTSTVELCAEATRGDEQEEAQAEGTQFSQVGNTQVARAGQGHLCAAAPAGPGRKTDPCAAAAACGS